MSRGWLGPVLAAALLPPATVGCTSGEASVALIFPNASSRTAIRRLTVEVYPPSTGGAAASDRDCRDFAGLAREGKDPLGTPTRGEYTCIDTPEQPCAEDWFNGLELLKVESGRQIVYVLAYAEAEEEATPILEGCTDRFDSTGGGDESRDVPITLELVVPESARLVKTAGDRQVGRAGQEAPVPLQVRVEADAPTGSGGTYVIPGVPIRYASDAAGYALVGGSSPDVVETFTDAEGLAEVRVRLPDSAGSGSVVARASALEGCESESCTEGTFSLSVTEPVRFAQSEAVQLDRNVIPKRLGLGQLDAGGALDVVLLGCRGSEAGCTAGNTAEAPFGDSVLTVVRDVVAGGQAPLTFDGPQGILPAGLVVADFQPDPDVAEIAVVNSRRAECQGRVCTADAPCPCYGVEPGGSCPCEGAEVRVYAVRGDALVLDARHTLTGSNAVDATAYRTPNIDPYFGLAVAAQGRSTHTRPCSRANRCLPFDPMVSQLCLTEPEACGCPAEERCECDGCGSTQEPGVCVARDKIVDLLVVNNRRNRLFNLGGCQMPVLDCNPSSAEGSTCECLDGDLTQNQCTGRDGCNCDVPDRIYIGDVDAPVLPYAIAAGPVDNAREWDFVIASIGGLDRMEAGTQGRRFSWAGSPIVNAPIHDATIVDLDTETERERGAPRVPDVVWYSQEPCLGGSNFARSCPIWQASQETEPVGCLGVYYTDGEPSVFELRTPDIGGCRRHQLEITPDGMCTGQFNGDDLLDVAIASRASSDVLVYTGDGRGGLLDPPERIPLPGDAGGPMACADLDGDGRDDMVVADRTTGAIYILRTGP